MRSSGGTSPTHRPQAELPEKIEMLFMLNKEGKNPNTKRWNSR